MNKRIYLDYNATTPLSDEVKKIFFAELELYANASSLHEDGRLELKKIEQARRECADLIGCTAPEILFTSGGSESNNMVFQTMKKVSLKNGRKTIVISAIEHPCVIESAKQLEKEGFKIIKVPVDEYGIVRIEAYRQALEENPLFVSIMSANNEIGTIQDIKTLCSMAHEKGALFHTDAVQAAGKITVDMKDWDADYATFSAHKIYGPKGIGALFVKKGTPIEPLIRGGHQEKGLRAGTYNAPSIAAFGHACLCAQKELVSYADKTRKLREKLRDGLIEKIPNIRINGHPERVLPNTLDVSFPGAEGEAILLHLDLLGISVSTGSACASGSLEPSHVLVATGLGPELAHGSIRFSFGKYNSESDVEYILHNFPPVIERLRKMSTLS
ncbi:MAG TPA: cysteine desulfurase family protein [Treponemataceae bacterium]|jgi:cysteine desulfurase|nr:cysteine desulfurase family protein [Treponemataceae bacterium]